MEAGALIDTLPGTLVEVEADGGGGGCGGSRVELEADGGGGD